MLERQIKTQHISRQEAQDLPCSEECNFATTDALKVPNEKDAASGSQDYEVAAVPGYVCCIKKTT